MSTAQMNSNAMAAAPLLVELFTEELPPKALESLARSFADQLASGLAARGLTVPDGAPDVFATPRRLAVRLAAVLGRAPDRSVELKGPSLKVGLDAQGNPTQALLKWADKQGVAVDGLRRASDGKQECFFATSVLEGEALADVIGPLIGQALAHLPIPKMMQYQLADGVTTVSFVRPAHGLVILHGDAVLPATVLGLASGRITFGHRFQSRGPISLEHAGVYEAKLESAGRVIAGFAARRGRIEASLRSQAAALNASLGDESGVAPLLDEVTALVEWPAVYVGEFEADFLQVPQECLILTMRTNQKYFPLFDAHGRLLPKFLIVSNMAIADPSSIIDGNQRVVRPRLADARFFFEQDKKAPLADRVPRLASVVYHAKLGTQAQRVERVRGIAGGIAQALGVDPAGVDRAALLAKADLLTGMVGEFPELQGTMGRCYALHDGESPAVANAIAEHYQPRFAGDVLPASDAGTVLALADKLETLAGLFSIGQHPTGDKDPFALRRHALGVVRILIEKRLSLSLPVILNLAFAQFASKAPLELSSFIFDRLGSYLRDKGFSADEVAAVVEQHPAQIDSLPARLEAVRAFARLPQAKALAAANKRIGNILRKSRPDDAQGQSSTRTGIVDPALLTDPAERTLAGLLDTLTPQVAEKMSRHDYTGALTLMAAARDPVDSFFNDVMVMAEDAKVRNNRLTLLSQLRGLMNQVADISKLSAA